MNQEIVAGPAPISFFQEGFRGEDVSVSAILPVIVKINNPLL